MNNRSGELPGERLLQSSGSEYSLGPSSSKFVSSSDVAQRATLTKNGPEDLLSDDSPLIHRPETELSVETGKVDAGVQARRARALFAEAMSSTEAEEAEASYMDCKSAMSTLWAVAEYRNEHFCELLSAIELAMDGKVFRELNEQQREVIHDALRQLPKAYLNWDDVASHIKAMGDIGIDLLLPMKKSAVRYRLTIEELE